MAFLAAERAALSYAVGEWARVWPLETLIRSMGAYFVRRDSGDPLYRAVLQRYVQMATDAGLTQAVFPEGGLSIDGHVRQPKLGLIDYMVRGFDPEGPRDVVFIPVGINYDRVLEDRSLLRKHDPAAAPAGFGRALSTTLGFALEQALLRARGRWFRFGYACVNFGTPLSLRAHLKETADRSPRVAAGTAPGRARIPRAAVDGSRQSDRSRAARGGRRAGLPRARRSADGSAESEGGSIRPHATPVRGGALVYLPRGDQDYAIEVGLRMLVLRRIVLEERGLFTANPAELRILDYYANSISHFLSRRPAPFATVDAGGASPAA